MRKGENEAFLKEQILTYLGNKRRLLEFIGQGFDFALDQLKKERASFLDLFAGSGVVSRFAKSKASYIVANDLELYSKITNECYLSNPSPELLASLETEHKRLLNLISQKPVRGFVSQLYAPANENDIKPGERVFYTTQNAIFIDSAIAHIASLPAEIRHFFLAPLLFLASKHSNTSGVFKGFYKNEKGIGQYGGRAQNALARIKATMQLPQPVFSNFNVPFDVYQKDARALAGELDGVDICYLDPPYNQHPYGSNYFMLNLIAKGEYPEQISKVSGIAKGWNRSEFNQKNSAAAALFEIIENVKASFVIISYNDEGLISKDEFEKKLRLMGKFWCKQKPYNAFRASRNLSGRNTYVSELLYIVKKDKK